MLIKLLLINSVLASPASFAVNGQLLSLDQPSDPRWAHKTTLLPGMFATSVTGDAEKPYLDFDYRIEGLEIEFRVKLTRSI